MQRLVIAAIYVFGIKRGVGAESLCEFFHKLHLETHIGISVSSLRKIQGLLEAEILTYQKGQHERLSQACTALPKMCVGVDETWFETNCTGDDGVEFGLPLGGRDDRESSLSYLATV